MGFEPVVFGKFVYVCNCALGQKKQLCVYIYTHIYVCSYIHTHTHTYIVYLINPIEKDIILFQKEVNEMSLL